MCCEPYCYKSVAKSRKPVQQELIRVTAPHFVANCVLAGNHCTEAAPILKWAIGRESGYLLRYFAKNNWSVERRVDPATQR